MKFSALFRLLAVALLTTLGAFFLGGCSSTHEREEAQLPWARPASWEGGMPGGFGQQGRGNAF